MGWGRFLGFVSFGEGEGSERRSWEIQDQLEREERKRGTIVVTKPASPTVVRMRTTPRRASHVDTRRVGWYQRRGNTHRSGTGQPMKHQMRVDTEAKRGNQYLEESLLRADALPLAVLSDSYKAGHFEQYPPAKCISAYGEFRRGFQRDKHDTRAVYYGMRYAINALVGRKWTIEDVTKAEQFFNMHRAPDQSPYPWPKELFLKIVHEHDGYFPVKIEAMPEGTCGHIHLPIYQITAEGEFSRLCTYLETLLTQVWYPTTVATLARRCRDVIEAGFEKSADGGKENPLVGSRLHDFGFRGCTCVEQSVIGGCAHLLNFDGTDTMSAAFYAQFVLNNGNPVASSIPATEHSVMTAWDTEKQALETMIEHYGDGIYACVMDSYDYVRAIEEILPSVAKKKVSKGGFLVLRPDSGDPTEAVLQGLHAAEKCFGVDINSKGYKVPRGCGVIQGDGVDLEAIRKILDAVMEDGFSAQAVAFGMGGGLLQRVNRDTMSFATKLNRIVYADGRERDVMKAPLTDPEKYSLPGLLAVKRVDGIPTVFPKAEVRNEDNLLRVVYDHGPVDGVWDDFSTLKSRVQEEWHALPKNYDAISQELKDLIRKVSPHTKV